MGDHGEIERGQSIHYDKRRIFPPPSRDLPSAGAGLQGFKVARGLFALAQEFKAKAAELDEIGGSLPAMAFPSVGGDRETGRH